MQPNCNTVRSEVETVNLDQHIFIIDQEQWQRLLAVLESPPQPSAALRNLLTIKAPWER